MRPAPAGYDLALAHGYQLHTSVSAWRSGVMLAADVPIASGRLDADGTQSVPETLSLTVPAHDPATGRRWLPSDLLDPLATAGQRLRVASGLIRDDEPQPVDLGWYRIDDWDETDGRLSITAVGLLAVLDELLGRPYQPAPGASLHSAAFGIVGGLLPVTITPDVANRPCPPSLAWAPEVTRLAALNELLAAWPAEAHVTAQGVLMITAPSTTTTPALKLESGDRGTVVATPNTGTRDGVYNAYLVTGTLDAASQAPVAAFELFDEPGHPLRYGGAFGPAIGKFASPIMTTPHQCAVAARTLIARSLRTVTTSIVTHAPDPRIEPGDVISVDGTVGRVISTSIPLTAEDGTQTTQIGPLP